MIVDSKVSITDYTQYVNSADPKEQEIFLKKHVKSIKHILINYQKKTIKTFMI